MEKIKVDGCHSCPFEYVDYDDYAVGSDTLLICNLARFKNSKDCYIDMYDSKKEEEHYTFKNFPDWCPLNAGEITITK